MRKKKIGNADKIMFYKSGYFNKIFRKIIIV